MEPTTNNNCTPTRYKHISSKTYLWFGLWLFEQVNRLKDALELPEFALAALVFVYRWVLVPYWDFKANLYGPIFPASHDLYHLFSSAWRLFPPLFRFEMEGSARLAVPHFECGTVQIIKG